MKKYSVLYVLLSIVFAVSCSKPPSNQTTAKPVEPAAAGKTFQVIMITDVGGLGDKGFNDAGWAGCQDAKKRIETLGGKCEIKTIESREQTDYTENISLAAERADAVVALGFLMVDSMTQVAKKYPNKPFILTDGKVECPNVASVVFKEEEGGFLAGLLAAFVTPNRDYCGYAGNGNSSGGGVCQWIPCWC